MIALLIKSSVVVALLLAFYKLFLEKESFFSKNRWYLIGCLVLAFVLPFITLPKLVPDQGIVSTTIEKIAPTEQSSVGVNTEGTILITDDIFEQSEPVEILYPTDKSIAKTTKKTEEIEDISTVKTEATAKAPIIAKPTTVESALGWSEWLLLIYFFGVLVFTLHLFTQIISLVLQIMKSTDRIKDTDCIIINMPGMKEPCSFFNYIFINPETYDYDTYEQILAHERIHVSQRHTIDLLLSELVAIILWFNPLAWLFRKEVEKNLEYQTDDLLLRQKAAEKEVYQMNLVKIATHNKPLTVTTNYNQSLIKQRILKMNTQKSNPHSYWKYAFIAPMIFGILLILNKPNSVFAASDFDSDERIVISDQLSETSDETFDKNTAITSEPTIDNLVEKASGNPATSMPLNADETACEKLESAVKKSNLEEVKRILENVEPSCFPGINSNDYEVFDQLKFVLDDNADIFLNPKTGSIIVNYLLTQIYDSNLLNHPGYKGRRDFNSGFGIKCEEMIKAEKDRDFDKLKKLYLAADAECLDNPTKENLEHLTYMKWLIKEGANMAIKPMTITINTTDLMNPSDGKRSFNTSISSGGETAFHGSYVEMEKMGVFEKGDDTQINWTGMENYEILENLDHMINFQDLSDSEKSEVLKLLKDDSGAVDLLEDYQILIDADRLEGTKAATIKKAVNEIIASTVGATKENKGGIDGCKSLLKAVSKQDVSELKRLLKYYDANCFCNSNETFRVNENHTVTITGKQSPLVNAARIGNTNLGKILINAGAKVDFHADGESSPLEAAQENGNSDFVKLLKKEESVVESIFGFSKRGKCKQLVTAIGTEDVAQVKKILKTVDVNCTCNNSEIFLQVEGGNYHESRSPLVVAARTGNLEIGKLLMTAGADVELHVRGDESALMAASTSGNLDFVKLLVEKGANVNKKVKGDGTPLINAVRSNHYEVAKLLLENGAKPTLSSPGDDDPVFHARRNGDRKMIKLLEKFDREE